jgi:hypothetical protein
VTSVVYRPPRDFLQISPSIHYHHNISHDPTTTTTTTNTPDTRHQKPSEPRIIPSKHPAPPHPSPYKSALTPGKNIATRPFVLAATTKRDDYIQHTGQFCHQRNAAGKLFAPSALKPIVRRSEQDVGLHARHVTSSIHPTSSSAVAQDKVDMGTVATRGGRKSKTQGLTTNPVSRSAGRATLLLRVRRASRPLRLAPPLPVT